MENIKFFKDFKDKTSVNEANGFDHIRLGRHMRHYVYPPNALTDIEGFEDGLKETCIKKLNELLDRAEVLKRVAIEQRKIIQKKTRRGSFDEYFLKRLLAYQFAEYFIIRKWLQYWTGLWRKVSNKPRFPIRQSGQSNHIGDREIQQALKFPLENLYEGRLRKVGSRFVGLCPFHKERTPSFYIFPDNHFYCFGCNAHGDSVEFISRLKNLKFPDAVRSLL